MDSGTWEFRNGIGIDMHHGLNSLCTPTRTLRELKVLDHGIGARLIIRVRLILQAAFC